MTQKGLKISDSDFRPYFVQNEIITLKYEILDLISSRIKKI